MQLEKLINNIARVFLEGNRGSHFVGVMSAIKTIFDNVEDTRHLRLIISVCFAT
jgi:hypothetical protein